MSSNTTVTKPMPKWAVSDYLWQEQKYTTELLTMELCVDRLDALSDILYKLIEEEIKCATELGGVFPCTPEEGRDVKNIRMMANSAYVKMYRNEIVAIAAYFSDTKEIGNVYVKPEHRGKGLAKDLVTRLLNEFDVERVNVVPSNGPAVALYKSLGFELYPVNPMRFKK